MNGSETLKTWFSRDVKVFSLRAGSRQKQPPTLPSVPATLKIGPLGCTIKQ